MIILNKNILNVRDNETKEFKPLNVLGTYDEIALKNEPRTMQAKMTNGTNGVITLTFTTTLDRNLIFGDEIIVIALGDYSISPIGVSRVVEIMVNNTLRGYAYNMPDKIKEDDIFMLKCRYKYSSETVNKFDFVPITKAVNKEDLSSYATDLSNYATKSELSNYATKSDLKISWSTFQLDSSANSGTTYYFAATTTAPIKSSLSQKVTANINNKSCFEIPINGTIIITINAWMSSSANRNDIGLFIYDYTDSTWYDYSVAGLGVLGETGKANYISITSCPIEVKFNHLIQVVARHHNGNIKVEDLSSYGTAYGVPYNNGNTITFRYI